jgi:predicted permease
MSRRRTDEDFADEIRAHLSAEIERLVDEGMPPDDARAEAHRRFGSVTRARERFHETQRFVLFEQLTQDLRYAWRGLRQSRAFVATTVLTLAIGMGLVTAVFAVFNAYVLRPFAVRDPYSLYSISWRSQEAGGSIFTWRDVEVFRARKDLFDDVIAECARNVSLTNQRLAASFVSGNYFDALGARVALGRALAPVDARAPGGEAVMVLSDRAWARLFDRDPAILGRELDINGRPMVVIGVMAGEFAGLEDVARDVWIPITMQGTLLADDDPMGATQPRQLHVTARLRRGVSPSQAQGSLAIDPFETRVRGRIDAVRARLETRSTPVRMTRQGFALLSPVFVAFGLVLIAASANASNVMLARAIARQREIGIRLSIGASRARIVRQLVTEGLLVALLAGGAGLALAAALRSVGTFVFVAMLPPTVAGRVRLAALDFDHRVFLFALVVAIAVTVLFALLPALQGTRISLTHALRGQMSGGVRSGTLRNLLLAGQVAVSLVLFIVAATLVRNSAAIRATDLGMETAGIISVRQNRNDTTLIARAYDALAADTRVAQSAVASRSPLFGDAPRTPVRQASGVIPVSYAFVSPEYLDLLHIPIVHGRGFSAQEAREQAPVAIVSAAGAKALWPADDPLAKTLRVHVEPPAHRVIASEVVTELRKLDDVEADATTVTVIGVAKDAVNGFVYEGTDPAHLYLPTSATGSRAGAILVRGRGVTLSNDVVRDVLQRVHSEPAAFDVLPIDEMVALQMFPLRAASFIGSLLSAIALALSISGLYGVLNYTFGQRTQEIGIRMALGATRGRVQRLVVVQSLRLATLGTLIGLTIGFAVMKLLSSLVRLDNVSVLDPSAFFISFVMMLCVIGIASCGPARRAASVDPSVMLRADG